MNLQEYANAVTTRRKDLGLSQAELAQRAGITRESLNRFESKGGDIRFSNLLAILGALGLDLQLQISRLEGNSNCEVRRIRNWESFVRGRQQALDEQMRRTEVSPDRFSPLSLVDGKEVKIVSWGDMPS